MSKKLQGKVSLITGGGAGIGRATALAFAAEGASLAVADIREEAARAVCEELRAAGAKAIAITVDVSKDAQVSSMVNQVVEHFGRLDVAFNNAAIEVEHEPLAKTSEEMFDRLMSVNVKGVWLCMKYEIQQMLKQGGGAI
ncbi:MAG: hypothetical protein RL385_5887, partial [Pseudomonadota bacterium]